MMKAKKQKEELAYFTDIQKRKNQEIVDLRKKTKIINWVVIVIFLVINSWLFYGAILKANTIYFYPISVLGDWQNVDKAVGEINLDFDANLKDFNENNSAIFEGGGIKQIFLGNFQNPSLTETNDKEIISAKLKINFRITDKDGWIKLQEENKEIYLVEPTPTLITIPLEEPTSNSSNNNSLNSESLLEQTIVPSESVLPETTNSLNSEMIISPNSTNLESNPASLENNILIQEMPSPINQPTPEENPTTTPISLLKTLFKKVFAQESPEQSNSEFLTPIPTNEPTPTNELIPTEEETSMTSDLTTAPTNSPIENTETPFETTTEIPTPTVENINPPISESESTTTLISPESSSSSVSPTPLLAPLFIVKYTLDGENWQILATIENKNNYSTEFDLPITDWNEITNLQIAIESTLNTNLEENLIAFLDGVQLEIEYNLIEEDTELVAPTVSIEPFEFLPEIKTILDILKTKIKPEIALENLDQKSEIKNSCSVKPFNLEIQAGEIKDAELFLERHQKGLNEKIIIGHLPMGIEIFFAKNNDYVIQPEDNESQFILKIISLTNSQKGNFSIPIIYQVDNSFNVCQINVISF